MIILFQTEVTRCQAIFTATDLKGYVITVTSHERYDVQASNEEHCNKVFNMCSPSVFTICPVLLKSSTCFA